MYPPSVEKEDSWTKYNKAPRTAPAAWSAGEESWEEKGTHGAAPWDSETGIHLPGNITYLEAGSELTTDTHAPQVTAATSWNEPEGMKDQAAVPNTGNSRGSLLVDENEKHLPVNLRDLTACSEHLGYQPEFHHCDPEGMALTRTPGHKAGREATFLPPAQHSENCV